MFDECQSFTQSERESLLTSSLPVVEHTTALTGLSHGALPLPQLQYEGFEPSPYEAEDTRAELEDISGPVSVRQLMVLSR
jgi:hypothetical protein